MNVDPARASGAQHGPLKRTNRLRQILPVAITLMALVAVATQLDLAGIEQEVMRLPPFTLVVVTAALTAGTVTACFRLQLVARDIGQPIRFRDALIATTAGALGGAMFFSIFGQVLARSMTLAKVGVSPSTTIVLTGYERAAAALVSFIFAVAGGMYLFGRIALDLQVGGAELAKLSAGAFGVFFAGALFAWGKAAIAALRTLTRRAVLGFARAMAMTTAVQSATMLAYIAAAHRLAPSVPFAALVSALAVVMFAASIPISFAGWGVREISAVYALGAIHMPPDAAFVTAGSIGFFSLGSTAVLALVGTAASSLSPRAVMIPSTTVRPRQFDANRFLAWILPLCTAMAVFFQVQVPVRTGRLNVNLADGLVVFGGIVFVLNFIRSRPEARLSHLPVYLAAMTLILITSFLHGWAVFGLTSWALVNRLLGWIFLLAYFGTGALMSSTLGMQGLRLLLKTFVAAGLAVASLDLVLLAMRFNGVAISFDVLGFRIAGFAGNPNAFAFQMLMVLAAALALQGTPAERTGRIARPTFRPLAIALLGNQLYVRVERLVGRLPLAITMTTLLFTESRASWGALVILLGIGLRRRAIGFRELIGTMILSALGALSITGDLPHMLRHLGDWAAGATSPDANIGFASALSTHLKTAMSATAASDNINHLQSILLGLQMWVAHPIFGAGLGAFLEEFTRAHGYALVIHSTPTWLLAETGILGSVVFAIPFVAVLRSELRREAIPDLGGHAIVFALIAIATMGAVHDLMYQRTLWLLLGAALFAPRLFPANRA